MPFMKEEMKKKDAAILDDMEKEIEQSSPFRRKKLYRVFIKYFAPICLIIILLSSIANVLGIISM